MPHESGGNGRNALWLHRISQIHTHTHTAHERYGTCVSPNMYRSTVPRLIRNDVWTASVCVCESARSQTRRRIFSNIVICVYKLARGGSLHTACVRRPLNGPCEWVYSTGNASTPMCVWRWAISFTDFQSIAAFFSLTCPFVSVSVRLFADGFWFWCFRMGFDVVWSPASAT